MTDAAKRKEASVHRNMPKAEKKKGQAACKPSDGHGNLEGLRTTREHGRSLCRLTWREHLQEAAKKNTSIVDSKRERSWLLITDRAIREGANSSLSWADIFRSRLSWAATREPQSIDQPPEGKEHADADHQGDPETGTRQGDGEPGPLPALPWGGD